ncbi:deoxyribodipyrimidine photo-lyase [Cupriavidus gilardii]|uniref:deoxyribodipyrimidine photo-lyase n=1 Tax=Cupriavidus gilardii TaxID=82541 RepID=UPI001ABE3333|nr:deoxyribodipyrimidine photo-lyase [Cupriavidus gilardii]MBO4119581.1 deoxyribodipyrimidine photo-lyase [Cupriavidus gilardii]
MLHGESSLHPSPHREPYRVGRSFERALVWFRRDLRVDDHAALHYALKHARRVWCVFAFDREILDPLLARGLRTDRRVAFILASLAPLDAALRAAGGGLIVMHATARTAIPELARELDVQAVFANHDYEPAAIERDHAVADVLAGLPDKYLHAPWTAPEAVLAAAGIVLGKDYPRPVVQHDVARQETLERYAVVKAGAVAAAGTRPA